MNKNLNFKIVGSGPTGLLLAITLSKLNFNIYLTDLLSREKLINKVANKKGNITFLYFPFNISFVTFLISELFIINTIDKNLGE